MSECILENRPPNIRDVLRDKMRGWHSRSCAALIGAATLMSLSLAGPASTPAAAQQQPAQKPNILFIMGDDIGMDAAEHLSPRPDGRRDAEHRSHRQRRCDVHGTTTPSRAARPGEMPSSPACIRCAPA